MATIWLTYSWNDNVSGDVDFLAQELERAGLTVKQDKWILQAGKPLWDQIEEHIQDMERSDAWAIYVTQNSLGSQACKEEFRYALDRALHTRGDSFPVIGLFNSSTDIALFPAGLRTRLCVSTTDADWKEKVVAAAEGRDKSLTRPTIEPYEVKVHLKPHPDGHFCIELRPRAGTWAPFAINFLIGEKDKLDAELIHGPAGKLPQGGVMFMVGRGASDDGLYWVMSAGNEATPTQSYFFQCKELPSVLRFGVPGTSIAYEYKFLTQ